MRKSTVIFCLALAIYSFAIYLEFISFTLWSQVTKLSVFGVGQIDPLTEAHFLRYLLVSPIFFFSQEFGLDHDRVFSFIAILILVLVARNTSKAAEAYGQRMECSHLLVFFMLLSIFMNGRLLFGFLGMSFLARMFLEYDYKVNRSLRRVFFIPVILLLCSISTGVFVVAVCSMYAWALSQKHRFTSNIGLSLLALSALLYPFVHLYVNKNISYHGGFLQMLEHGAGSVLDQDMFLVLLVFVTLLAFILTIATHAKRMNILHISSIFCMIGGFFGFSTFLSGMPIFLCMFCQPIRKFV